MFGIAYGGEGDRGLFGLAFTRTAGLAAAYSAVERSHKWTDNKVARLGSPAADQMGADELTDSPRAEPPSCLTINIGRRVVASDVLNRRLPARAYEPAARRRLAVVLNGCIYCWNSVGCPARSLSLLATVLATWNASWDPSRHLSPYTSICSSRSWLD